jgi:hypothetical protein
VPVAAPTKPPPNSSSTSSLIKRERGEGIKDNLVSHLLKAQRLEVYFNIYQPTQKSPYLAIPS